MRLTTEQAAIMRGLEPEPLRTRARRAARRATRRERRSPVVRPVGDHGRQTDVVDLCQVHDEAAVEAIALALARWLVADLVTHPEIDP